jgi:hypothetical protein
MLTQIIDWQNAVAASALPPMARHLAHVLALHFLRGIPAAPGLNALERQTGVTRKTVLAALAALEEARVIKVARTSPLQIRPVTNGGTIPLSGGVSTLLDSGATPPSGGTIPLLDSGTIPLSGGVTPPPAPPSSPPHTPPYLPPKKTDFLVADMPAQERPAYNRHDPFGLNPANRDADRLVWWSDDGRLYAAPAMEAEISAALPGQPLRDVLDRIAGYVPVGMAGLHLLTKVRAQIATQKDFAARRLAADQTKTQNQERKNRGADYIPWG